MPDLESEAVARIVEDDGHNEWPGQFRRKFDFVSCLPT